MKQKIYLGLIALSFNAIAQTPTGSPPPLATTPANTIPVANSAWYRGGNFATGPAGNNNIFGTATGFNSPIYTITNGLQRTKLNGTQTAVIAGVPQNVDGYFGISPTGYFGQPGNTPWAMLHLDGPNNTNFGGDWRKWMRTGTFMRENSDAMYVGLKEEVGANRSDAVINWSDDANSAGGPF
jgi:hypothetical protein